VSSSRVSSRPSLGTFQTAVNRRLTKRKSGLLSTFVPALSAPLSPFVGPWFHALEIPNSPRGFGNIGTTPAVGLRRNVREEAIGQGRMRESSTSLRTTSPTEGLMSHSAESMGNDVKTNTRYQRWSLKLVQLRCDTQRSAEVSRRIGIGCRNTTSLKLIA
jgi:hypothetical protein